VDHGTQPGRAGQHGIVDRRAAPTGDQHVDVGQRGAVGQVDVGPDGRGGVQPIGQWRREQPGRQVCGHGQRRD
jgi:hypothetical protein